MPATSNLRDRFVLIENELSSELFERNREIRGSIVALLSRKHFLMVGPPGVAKSLLVRRLVNRIDFSSTPDGDQAYFQWLLTKYTTPEEVFGPPSLPELRDTGRYVRQVDGKLPCAHIAFLDEYRRANSSILNSLLTIMNERLFFNDGVHSRVPLDVVYAGTNSFEPDDDLHAIDDRFHLRYQVRELQENGSVFAMLTTQIAEEPVPLVTYADVQRAQQEVAQVVLPNDVIETIISLRDMLRDSGVEPSDRRFAESLPIVRAEAWLNGRTIADIDDLRILRHVMWSRLEDQRPVEKAVLELSNPIDKEASDLLDKVIELDKQLKKVIKEADNPKSLASAAVEIHHKMHRVKKAKDALRARNDETGRRSEILDSLDSQFIATSRVLMKDALTIERSDA